MTEPINYRPRYHFTIPGNGNPGDSNGAFWHQGRYHLMYLVKRDSGYCWGHVSSTDLLSWQHHEDAIGPGPADPGGCFSGGGFLDDDGTAYLTYWMLWGARGLGIAKSTGPLFEKWEKLPENPVVRSTSWGWTKEVAADGSEQFYGSADPSNIWKAHDTYYFLSGNLCLLNDMGRQPDSLPEFRGDKAFLFASKDLRHWSYKHPFYQRRTDETRQSGWTDNDEDCMCPSFLPLPSMPDGGEPSGKYLLLFISHNRGCQYYIGDYQDDQFVPLSHGRMTWQDSSYFAPEAVIDGKGRQIIWTWLRDNLDKDVERFGWSGVYGLPRSVWLAADGTLGIAPIEELKQLRGKEIYWPKMSLQAGERQVLADVAGDCCELAITLDVASADAFALHVRASADGEERTVICYDRVAQELVFDSTMSARQMLNYSMPEHVLIERAPLVLQADEPLNLRVYVDGPVVEVFANDRQAICRRVYPNEQSNAVAIVATEGTVTCQVTAWDILPPEK